MGLLRFGSSALDPSTIARIEDQANRAHGAGDRTCVIVRFHDKTETTFWGADAQAFRKFVIGLPDGVPLASSFGATSGGGSPADP